MLHLSESAVQKQAVLHKPVTTNKLIKTKQINFAHYPFRVQQNKFPQLLKSNSLHMHEAELLLMMLMKSIKAIHFTASKFLFCLSLIITS